MSRPKIPDAIADKILVDCRHRCCICGHEAVQIHHIDGNPLNNSYENLIPLCPNCHSRVTSRAAGVRQITPNQLKMYRDKWITAWKTPTIFPNYEAEFEEIKAEIRSLREMIKQE